jgi:putative flippase GtrA
VKAVDIREAVRFVLVGIAATIGNLTAVWLVRHVSSFEIALLAGVATGMTLSFFLSKFFAFRSSSWRRAQGEASRFLIVYGGSVSVYWIVALVSARLLSRFVPTSAAELMGVVLGACPMTVISYLGHRFFTYRTNHVLAPSREEP